MKEETKTLKMKRGAVAAHICLFSSRNALMTTGACCWPMPSGGLPTRLTRLSLGAPKAQGPLSWGVPKARRLSGSKGWCPQSLGISKGWGPPRVGGPQGFGARLRHWTNNRSLLFSSVLFYSKRIYLSIPCSVCEGERSFSKLARIKNKKRTTMRQKRLNSLSFMSIEHELAMSSRNLQPLKHVQLLFKVI
jgi:hypothetical protein